MNSLTTLLDQVLEFIDNPRQGLPEPVFQFVSRLTPLVNVDLLIKNDDGQTLLTWREDQFYGPGWHVPGGIIRFKESAQQRIAKVAANELGVTVSAAAEPLAIKHIMAQDRDVRGHFVSLLYPCRLEQALPPDTQAPASHIRAGQWQWHDRCPENIIKQHLIYREYMENH